MQFAKSIRLTTLAVLVWASLACTQEATANAEPAPADKDFAIQGEYVGELMVDGVKGPWGGQVIALGGGKFHAVGYPGGLPGEGWNKKEKKHSDGQREGNKVVFQGDGHRLVIEGDTLTVLNSGGDSLGQLTKVTRKSPTLGAKPPEGAVVLFDGTSADQFEKGRINEVGLLMEGATAKPKAQNFSCHLEFLLPYMPASRGQQRGNSGCYLQGRYEVQMLDSFGLEGKANECGGIYAAAPPTVNMCYPPLSWQTYDVDFTAPVFEGGKKVKNARVTVRHNGVVVQDDTEIPRPTPGGVDKESAAPGSVMYLQNHGNPVCYRNIWYVEK